MPNVLVKKDTPKSLELKSKDIATTPKSSLKKSAFEIECESGFTIEQSRKRIHDKIDSLWKK
jgi:hypothetical protein